MLRRTFNSVWNYEKRDTRPEAVKSLLTLQPTGVQSLAAAPSTEDSALVTAYRNNPIVRACVDITANATTDPRLIVQNRKDMDWEEVVGHPFRRLLMMPNPNMDGAMFFDFAQTSIEVTGIFYAEIVRSAALPVELHPLQPLNVTPKYEKKADGSQELMYYEYKDGSFQKDIPAKNMLVRDDMALGGRLSPLASSIRSVDSDMAQTDYVRSFFNNAGVPSGVLKIHNRILDQEESDEIRQNWRARYGRGFGGQHDVAVFDENADYEQLGAKLSELDSVTLRGLDESRICMAFGVPPLVVYAYVGLLRATYSNLGEAWEHFWLTTMSTKLKQWRSFFTVNLLGEFEELDSVLDEKSRLFWDMTDVGALQENVDSVQERERKMFLSGGVTLNEYRLSTGRADYYDPELGDMNYFQLKAQATMGSGFDQPAEGTPATGADIENEVDEEEPQQQTPPVDDSEPADDVEEETVEEPKRYAVTTVPVRGVKAVMYKAENRWMETKQERAEQEALEKYGEELYALADKARNGEMSKDSFIKELRDLSASNIVAFFLLGSLLKDGDLTDVELAAIGTFIENAEVSAGKVADDIYDGRYGGLYRDEEEDGEATASLGKRMALWVGAASAVMVVGRTFREDNPSLMWRRGPTEEPCHDCLAFEGQVWTAEQWRTDWDTARLPQGMGLECGGFNCLCDLQEV